MYDSLNYVDRADVDAPYEIRIHNTNEPDRTFRFRSYREAYAHSYRNDHAPIWFTDEDGTEHLCGHINGQEIYQGHDAPEVEAENVA